MCEQAGRTFSSGYDDIVNNEKFYASPSDREPLAPGTTRALRMKGGRSGGVEEWRSGGVEEWRSGGLCLFMITSPE
ncbi:hypothetical protein EYF80_030957 [Liparis tanakae]|uniref:Uncharacterized protein n=1 Tax=Liparis tanakae TaxID=230148 RepID=A0A4Z2GYX2_9TELE|nr:hypothetical protein EYF80_030957 [Liparis tanakae]